MIYSEKQIDEYRTVNVDHDWWDSVYDHWKRTLARFGIACDEINFSGFWSQGDGASFVGWVENDQRFITFMCADTKSYPLWRKLAAKDCGLNIKIVRNDRSYVHECSVSVEVEADLFMTSNYYDEDELLTATHRVWDDTIQQEYREFEQDCRDFVRALCRYIYKDLEREYEYLTSDEVVIDWMQANDIMPEDDAEDQAEVA